MDVSRCEDEQQHQDAEKAESVLENPEDVTNPLVDNTNGEEAKPKKAKAKAKGGTMSKKSAKSKP